MLKIGVRYFAALREQSGEAFESIETESHSLRELYAELRSIHGFKLDPSKLKASLNGEWVNLDSALRDGDEVVFIPPVAGG